MTPVHAIMVLIIRLWAAGVIISMITSAPTYLIFSGVNYSDRNYILIAITILQLIVWLAAGVTAWVVAPKLARLVYPAASDRDVSIDVDADRLVMIGSFLIGGYYLVQYVPQLLISLGTVLIEIGQRESEAAGQLGKTRVHAYSVRSFFTDASIIVAASWMAFKPAHIARVFSWLRSAGQYDHSRDKLEKDLETSQ